MDCIKNQIKKIDSKIKDLKWNINFSKENKIEGTILPQPILKFGNSTINSVNGSFQKNLKRPLLESADMSNWAIFYLEEDQQFASQFVFYLKKISGDFAIFIEKPKYFSVKSLKEKKTFEKFLINSTSNFCKFAVFLSPKNKSNLLYPKFKEIFSKKLGIPSQFLVIENVFDCKFGNDKKNYDWDDIR